MIINHFGPKFVSERPGLRDQNWWHNMVDDFWAESRNRNEKQSRGLIPDIKTVTKGRVPTVELTDE